MPLSTTIAPDLSSCKTGSIYLKLADNKKEVEKAQKLRKFVFFDEPLGKKEQSGEIDSDEFDELCEHLLVVDEPEGKEPVVVGTYRLLRKNETKNPEKFYTDTEFDISKLLNSKYNLLELGRSCIHPDYRDGKVIQLLWKGIGIYIAFHNINYLFGCASFMGVDAEKHRNAISFLMHYHKAPDEISPIARDEISANIDLIDKEKIDKKSAFGELPTLLKGYIRAGCMVGDGAIIDDYCKTTDVCMIMDTSRIAKRYSEHFVKE